jgi:hypothetical protein
MKPTKLGFTIAIAVTGGILAAQAIPAILSEVYYAANPCDRPGLPASVEASCEFRRAGERLRKWNEELKAEREAKEQAFNKN